MDVEALRQETEGCGHRIHLNNAGASLMPRSVVRTVTDHLHLEERIGGYEAAAEAAEDIRAAYGHVANLVGASWDEIAFVENATVAVAQALSSIPFRSGDVLATTRSDYVSNQVMYLSLEERFGVEVVRAPDREEGGVDPLAMQELIHRRRPKLVTVTHVPSFSGLVQPVESIGAVCREERVPYLVDACQSIGQMPVDVEAIGCDFLAATSRKFLRGPRGAGFLYVARRALDEGRAPLFPDLRGADWIAEDLFQPVDDARRFENWEFAYALVLGTGEAARLATSVGLDAVRDRVRALADRLREGLAGVPGCRVMDRGDELGAIVTAHLEGVEPSEMVGRLRRRGVNASSVEHGSAVLAFEDAGVESVLRLSPHCFNTEEEVDRALEALEEAKASGVEG